jgi:hypothetical protein
MSLYPHAHAWHEDKTLHEPIKSVITRTSGSYYFCYFGHASTISPELLIGSSQRKVGILFLFHFQLCESYIGQIVKDRVKGGQLCINLEPA